MYSIKELPEVDLKLLDAFERPSGILKVINNYTKVFYGDRDVQFGDILTPSEAEKRPRVTWEVDPTSKYILIMTDPDAPSRDYPRNKEWYHWVVINIPGNRISDGQEWVQYAPPTPPSGTGDHRYTFLVFKQPGKIHLETSRLSSRQNHGREKQNTQKIADKHNLGNPVAANMFYASSK